jgi:AcrR family transcriptional regulator
MGHREDLLEGAKRCLFEKGYARTTARDIVAASGANLASIGYHYRSTEALLQAAMIEAIQEWSTELGQALATEMDTDATPLERFETIWARIIESFTTHRQLWVATFEALMQSERSPQLRAFLADALQQGRLGLAALFQGNDTAVDEEMTRTVGAFYQALLSGIWVQWMIDPQKAPSGRSLAEALQKISQSIGPYEGPDLKRDASS